MIPSAIISQRVRPPNILTNTVLTLGSERMMRNEDLTVSDVAFPPVSRKLAQLPPCRVSASTVFMARPAPFTIRMLDGTSFGMVGGCLPRVPMLPSPLRL